MSSIEDDEHIREESLLSSLPCLPAVDLITRERDNNLHYGNYDEYNNNFVMIDNVTYRRIYLLTLQSKLKASGQVVSYIYSPATRKIMVEFFDQNDVDNALSAVHNQLIGLQRLTAHPMKGKVCSMCLSDAIYSKTCLNCLDQFYCSDKCRLSHRDQHFHFCVGLFSYYVQLRQFMFPNKTCEPIENYVSPLHKMLKNKTIVTPGPMDPTRSLEYVRACAAKMAVFRQEQDLAYPRSGSHAIGEHQEEGGSGGGGGFKHDNEEEEDEVSLVDQSLADQLRNVSHVLPTTCNSSTLITSASKKSKNKTKAGKGGWGVSGDGGGSKAAALGREWMSSRVWVEEEGGGKWMSKSAWEKMKREEQQQGKEQTTSGHPHRSSDTSTDVPSSSGDCTEGGGSAGSGEIVGSEGSGGGGSEGGGGGGGDGDGGGSSDGEGGGDLEDTEGVKGVSNRENRSQPISVCKPVDVASKPRAAMRCGDLSLGCSDMSPRVYNAFARAVKFMRDEDVARCTPCPRIDKAVVQIINLDKPIMEGVDVIQSVSVCIKSKLKDLLQIRETVNAFFEEHYRLSIAMNRVKVGDIILAIKNTQGARAVVTALGQNSFGQKTCNLRFLDYGSSASELPTTRLLYLDPQTAKLPR